MYNSNNSHNSNLFDSIVFYIVGISIGEQNKLKTLIKKNGGSISLQVNTSVHYLITTSEEVAKSSYKINSAIKLVNQGELRIISSNYITDCAEANKLISDATYQLYTANNNILNSTLPSSKTTPSKSSSTTTNSNNSNKFKFKSTSSTFSGNENNDKNKNKKCYNILELITKDNKQQQQQQSSAAGSRSIRLFISSTFTDMKQEREILVSHLMSELSSFCRDRNLDFSFVDLRWGITREQSQRTNSISTCLNEVAGCTHFISLLGERYGWCDGDLYDTAFKTAKITRPWMESYHGHSITELEIVQATKYAPNQKNHFFYIKENKSSNNDNSAIATERLSHLKKVIRDNQLLNGTYNEHDLNSWIKTVFRDITESIEKEYPIAANSISGNDQSRLDIDMNLSYLRQISKNYLHCNVQALEKLNDFVRISSTTNEAFLLVGESGIGKSTHIAHWLSELGAVEDVSKTLVVVTIVGLNAKSHQPYDVLKSTFETIKAATATPVPIPDDPTMLQEDIDFWMNIASKDNRKFIWVIDGVDRLGKTGYKLNSILPKQLTSNVKIVLTVNTASQTETTQSLTQLYGKAPIVNNLVKFNSTQMRSEFCSMYLSIVGKELDSQQLETISKIDQTPLFILMVLNELITTATFETIDEKLKSMLRCTTSEQLFQLIVQRWKSNTLYPDNLVNDTLQLLYHSNFGLYEEELMSMLQLSNTSGFISAARGILTMDGCSNYLSLHSQPLKEVVRKDGLSTNSKKYLELLVNFFNNDNNNNSRDLILKSFTPITAKRRVQLLPRYLEMYGDKVRLQQFLLKLEYLPLLVSEYSNTGLWKLWEFVGVEKKQIVHLYRTEFSKYRAPLQEQAEITKTLGLFFEYLSFYDDAWTILDTAKDYHAQLNGEVSVNVQHDMEALALITLKQSKLDTSLYLSEKSLSIAEKIFGSDQYGTFESLLLVGMALKKQANYDVALEYYERAKNTIHRYFGYQESAKSGPQYFNSKLASLYLNLGDVYRKKALFDQASQYYEKSITILSNIRSEYDVGFAELYRDLGLVQKKLGNYLKSREYIQKALNNVKMNYSVDHVNYGLYLCDMADTIRKQDGYTEAELKYYEALTILISNLGDENIEVAEVYNNLGLIKKKLGNYKEAIELYKKALTIAENALGKSHTKVGFFIHNLGDCYRKLGDYKQCEGLFARSLSISQNHFGFDHPEVAEILNSMGLVYKKQSKYQMAEKEYKRAITIVSKSLGAEHPKYGIYTNNLADVYRKLGKFDIAKSLYNKALKVIENSLGCEHSEYAEVLYGLGLLNLGMEQFEKSIELIKNAIDITSKDLGDKHPKIGIYLNSLCEVRIAREKSSQPKSNNSGIEPFSLKSIQDCYDRAYKILVADLGTGHPEIADIYVNIANLEFDFGSHQVSKVYFTKALDIISEVFGTEHAKYISISDRIRYFIGDVIQTRSENIDNEEEKAAQLKKEKEEDDYEKAHPYEVDLILKVTNATRSSAIAALRKNNNDIVTAIVDLSG